MTFGSFFIPGPTEVRPEVLAAMVKPMIAHRSKEFENLFERCQNGLKQVFLTQRPVIISTSSATGLMEAGIRCAPPGPVLCLVNGAFSERFANIAQMCGREVTRYDVEWGEVHEIARLKELLSEKKYVAVTVVHSETSTGALNNVRAVSDMVHEFGALCLIDSVSGLAGAELRFDEWGLDYVLTGSQKAFALPPGLAFAVASQKYLELARESIGRGVYFDIVEAENYARKNSVANTPALSLYYALEVQLQRMVAEGIEKRWKRHLDMQSLVFEWAKSRGLQIKASEKGRSPTVSAVVVPQGITGEKVVKRAGQQGITLGGGYGKLKDSTFRIGHMGEHTTDTIQRCLDVCSTIL